MSIIKKFDIRNESPIIVPRVKGVRLKRENLGPQERRVWDILQMMPPGAWVRNYVEYAMECTDAPIHYHLTAALICISQIAPVSLCYDAMEVKANMFAMNVGASTVSRKTMSIKLARKIIRAVVPEADGATPGSDEALRDSLHALQRQVLIFEEFGHFLASSENNYKTSIKPTLNELWDCSPIGRDTVKVKKGLISEPRLSLFAGCAPGYLERHTELVDWQDGFFARFVVMHALRERHYELPYAFPDIRESLIARLRVMAESKTVGRCVGMTPEAQAEYVEWTSRLEKMAVTDEQNAAALGRTPANTLKAALFLAFNYGAARRCSTDTDEWRLDIGEIAPAIAIMELHVESVIKIVSELAPSLPMLDRRRVLRAVGYSPTRLGTILKKGQILKKYAMTILESLVEEGEIVNCSGGIVAADSEEAGLRYKRVPASEQRIVLTDYTTEAPPPVVPAPEAVDLPPTHMPPAPVVPVPEPLNPIALFNDDPGPVRSIFDTIDDDRF